MKRLRKKLDFPFRRALAVLLVAIYPLNETRISEIGEKLALRRAANK